MELWCAPISFGRERRRQMEGKRLVTQFYMLLNILLELNQNCGTCTVMSHIFQLNDAKRVLDCLKKGVKIASQVMDLGTKVQVNSHLKVTLAICLITNYHISAPGGIAEQVHLLPREGRCLGADRNDPRAHRPDQGGFAQPGGQRRGRADRQPLCQHPGTHQDPHGRGGRAQLQGLEAIKVGSVKIRVYYLEGIC